MILFLFFFTFNCHFFPRPTVVSMSWLWSNYFLYPKEKMSPIDCVAHYNVSFLDKLAVFTTLQHKKSYIKGSSHTLGKRKWDLCLVNTGTKMQFVSLKIILWTCKIKISTEDNEFNVCLFVFPKILLWCKAIKSFSYLILYRTWGKCFWGPCKLKKLQGANNFHINSIFRCIYLWKH